MSEKKQETKLEVLSTGKFAEFYTLKTFVAFYQAFNIDKVKCSFVNIGTKGKGVDIYIDTDDFDLLCEDILSDKLRDKFLDAKKNEKGYYIPSWEYFTGDNASKQITLCRGVKKPIVITGVDTKTQQRIMVSLESYNELRIMARWWKRISRQYYYELGNAGYQAKNSYFTNKPSEN